MKHDPLMVRSVRLGSLFGQPDVPRPPRHVLPPIATNRKARRHAKPKQEKTHYEVAIATPEERDFRHQHWAEKRKLVRNILPQCGTRDTALQSFDECGAEAVVEHDKRDNRYRLRGSYCHSRHCEPCMKARADLMRWNLLEKIKDHKEFQYRFITLTLKHTDDELRVQIDRLYASFKKLRNTRLWKSSQRGGCAILEVKWSPDTGEWHPHLHIIAEGDHMLKDRLSQEWLHCTGDSHVVDIKLLREDKDAAFYLCKYVSKGTNNEVWYNEAAAIEWVCSIKGTRTAATFGSWRGYALMRKPKDDRKWIRIGSLAGIVKAANEGHRYYIDLLDKIRADLQYNPHRPRNPSNPTTPPIAPSS